MISRNQKPRPKGKWYAIALINNETGEHAN